MVSMPTLTQVYLKPVKTAKELLLSMVVQLQFLQVMTAYTLTNSLMSMTVTLM